MRHDVKHPGKTPTTFNLDREIAVKVKHDALKENISAFPTHRLIVSH